MIFFQCFNHLVFFCCPQRQPDSHPKWLSPLLSPLSSIHPMFSPLPYITCIQVCSLCASSCFRRMLWLLLCPMHVSVYVYMCLHIYTYVYTYLSCIYTHTYRVYNKVVSKFTIMIIAKLTLSLRTTAVSVNTQASRLARGTLMWSLSTHNWSAYGIYKYGKPSCSLAL